MPRISIIIVNYNVGALLMESVASALPQADEVIVVDNGSEDSSIEACIERFPDEGRLKIVRNNANLGFAAACNIGSHLAMGDYLFYLNPDCILDRYAVSELIKALEAQDNAAMAGGLLLNPDGSEQGGGRRAVPTPWRSFVRASGLSRYSSRWPKLFYDFYLHKQPLPDHPIEVEAISGACMLVKRTAVNAIGLWDEGYFLHCEDLDWCMRFTRQGWKILFVPTARIIHHLGVCSKSRAIFVEWHKHKGMTRFYRKFFLHQYPGVLMWLVVAGVWLRFCMLAGYHMAKPLLLRLRGR